jgi:prepilin-type N-terminal cleavage/methylation domain-containing protein
MDNRGFSLNELSIALIIISMITGGALSVWLNEFKGAQSHQSKNKIQIIEMALTNYVAINNRLPCPANGSLPEMNINFGEEYCTGNLVSTATLPNCSPACIFNNNQVIAGAVPFRALNLPMEFATDGWGHRIMYVVSRGFTGVGSGYGVPTTPYDFRIQTKGIITILDASNNVRTSEAVFAVISYGKNGFGAYPKGGGGRLTGETDANQIENAHSAGGWDSIFVQKAADDEFDDIVSFKVKEQIVSEIGGLVASPACITAKEMINTGIAVICNMVDNPNGAPPSANCTNYIASMASKLDDLCFKPY